ncbi:WecB/TagA/CpsF family glycosyltransferase [Paracoccaceae bacterium]|nr:WecB/TagA/CpsF family glycosyltransferase [Paracoccaceae bacterium]
MDFEVVNENVGTLARRIVCSMDDGENKKSLTCINPHSYAVALEDTDFFASIKNSDFVVIDGVGLQLCAQIINRQAVKRITGYDVFINVMGCMNENKNKRVFFLGSDEENLNLIKEKVQKEYPNISIVGTYSPPFVDSFSKQDIVKISDAIDKCKVDALWVGLTAPKQEKLIEHLKLHCNFKWAFAVGAVFDYYTGKLYRPGPLVRQFGLEWLFRLTQQPKKIGKRLFFSNMKFIIYCLKRYISR